MNIEDIIIYKRGTNNIFSTCYVSYCLALSVQRDIELVLIFEIRAFVGS